MVFQLDISNNQLCGLNEDGRGTYTAEGITAIANALRVNGGLMSLDLSTNALCGVTFMGGTYTAEGITAIAHALRVNGALTECDLIGNYMGEEGKASIRNAVQGKDGFKLHL
jgi:NLR family CARD domain-containing protein 3